MCMCVCGCDDVARREPRSDLKSMITRSAFAAAEWKAVLAFDTKVGDSISCTRDAHVTPRHELSLYLSLKKSLKDGEELKMKTNTIIEESEEKQLDREVVDADADADADANDASQSGRSQFQWSALKYSKSGKIK